MSRHISSNYFEEEIDDEEFLRHPKSGSVGYALPHHNSQVIINIEADKKELVPPLPPPLKEKILAPEKTFSLCLWSICEMM